MMKFKYKFTKKQNWDYYFSFLMNLFHVFSRAVTRKPGISVMIRVKDEGEWIALSLKSLQGFADEVVIVDNGSRDNTLSEIERVRRKLSYPVIFVQDEDPDMCCISNKALQMTSYRWIVRWDADFIAFTSGENDIKKLRHYLLSLNQSNYYLIYPLILSFAGDLFHVKTSRELHSEGYIHTYHPKLKYIKRGKFEVLKVPFFYRIKRILQIKIFHIGSAKSWRKLLYRFYWLQWLKDDNYKQYPNIEDFIRKSAGQELNEINFKQITLSKFQQLILPVRKYDVGEFGDYPDLLKPKLENPDFLITYKEGKPSGRTDFEDLD